MRTRAMTLLAILLIATAPAAVPQSEGASARNVWGDDNVLFELIGQAQNIPPGSPQFIQFGYLSAIAGLERIFTTETPAQQNEKTAHFTFTNTSTTLRVIAHGPLRIATREGTMTVLYNTAPDGDFASAASFAKGVAVQTSTWRHQVVFEPASGKFTVVFVNTIMAADPFDFRGERVQLGRPGNRYRIVGSGLADSVLGGFKLAGYAIPMR